MASSSALQMLLDLASDEVDEAAKNLATANKALKAAQESSAMLKGYKQDYIDHFNQQQQAGLGKEIHLNNQYFLQNLEQAIGAQADVVVSTQYDRDNMQQVLQAAQRKKMSYEVLIKRAEQKAMAKMNKREQKMMDEFAMRAQRTRAKSSMNE